MTHKQLQLMKLISNYKQTTGEAPTYSEMKKAIGVTSNQTVSDHLDALEKLGFITRDSGKKRGILVTERGQEALAVIDTRVAKPTYRSIQSQFLATGTSSILKPVLTPVRLRSVALISNQSYGGINNVTNNWNHQSTGNRSIR